MESLLALRPVVAGFGYRDRRLLQMGVCQMHVSRLLSRLMARLRGRLDAGDA